MQLSQKKYIFPNFFFHFLNLDSIFNIFKKKMTLIAYVFSNLPTPIEVVREVSKNSPFGGLFNKYYGKHAETLF